MTDSTRLTCAQRDELLERLLGAAAVLATDRATRDWLRALLEQGTQASSQTVAADNPGLPVITEED